MLNFNIQQKFLQKRMVKKTSGVVVWTQGYCKQYSFSFVQICAKTAFYKPFFGQKLQFFPGCIYFKISGCGLHMGPNLMSRFQVQTTTQQ